MFKDIIRLIKIHQKRKAIEKDIKKGVSPEYLGGVSAESRKIAELQKIEWAYKKLPPEQINANNEFVKMAYRGEKELLKRIHAQD